MSAKRPIDEAQTPHSAITPHPSKKARKVTDIVLPEDVLGLVVTFVDFKGLPALACACKMTRDAACDVNWLARDKTSVLRCWLALDGKEDTLTRGYKDEEDGYKWKMRDEPSDDLAEWPGVTVVGGRVTRLFWSSEDVDEFLTGTIPAEIGALDCLTWLDLSGKQICGHLPSEIGRLTSLKRLMLYDNRLEGPLPAELGALTALIALCLNDNTFTGEIPSTLMNLTNLKGLDLNGNNFDTDLPSDWIDTTEKVQAYLSMLRPNHDML